jgi:hypothetical protein
VTKGWLILFLGAVMLFTVLGLAHRILLSFQLEAFSLEALMGWMAFGLFLALGMFSCYVMAEGMLMVFQTIDEFDAQVAILGLVAMVIGLTVLFFMPENPNADKGGPLLLMIGAALAIFGLHRAASHELLYGGEKERENQKEGGEE